MDNGINKLAEKGVGPSLPTSPETKTEDTTPAASSATVMANGPTGVASESTSILHTSQSPRGSRVDKSEVTSSSVGLNKLGSAPPPIDADKSLTIACGTEDACGQPTPSSSKFPVLVTPASSAVCFSPSDPVLVPSNDSRVPGAVGAIKREVGTRRTPAEPNAVIPAENNSNASQDFKKII